MNGLVLLPTLNRIELLKNFIKSYEDTKAEVEVWVLVDGNDANDYDSISRPAQVKIVRTGPNVTMGDKVRFACRERLNSEPNDFKWIGILNDDHYCITQEWDKIVDKMIDGTNMVSTNDGFWNFGFRVVGLTAWSMPVLEAAGFPIFPEGIHHYFIDDVWKAIGERTGCWLETMKVNIEHRHVFNGGMQRDATFDKVNDPLTNQEQLKAFEKFMNDEYPKVCERILELRASHLIKSKFA